MINFRIKNIRMYTIFISFYNRMNTLLGLGPRLYPKKNEHSLKSKEYANVYLKKLCSHTEPTIYFKTNPIIHVKERSNIY
jgi:hypothetical protein